jgi:hypothetical protein
MYNILPVFCTFPFLSHGMCCIFRQIWLKKIFSIAFTKYYSVIIYIVICRYIRHSATKYLTRDEVTRF